MIACRACGSQRLQPVLDLGMMPLANAYLTHAELAEASSAASEARYPLALAFCPGCSLAQITETVPADKLFREYLYFSSYSNTMLTHARTLASDLISARGLNGKSLVVEVASNDGYLLQYFKEAGIPVLGIEPAVNVADAAEKKGIPSITEFFDEDLAGALSAQGKLADVIAANNVMAHVAGINGFAKSLALLLKQDGVASIEVPYVREMVERAEFDTIYHEHIFYFSVTALNNLFKRHGLSLEKVARIPIHGGSLRLNVSHSGTRAAHESVQRILEEEAELGIGGFDFYSGFSKRVETLTRGLKERIAELKQSGKRIAAYGAAAKGTVLLNYCGLDNSLIDFVVDRSPHKQGRYMPGVHIPIYPPEKLTELQPDFTLLLVWNLAEEIIGQSAEYLRRGGAFIVPLPEPRVIGEGTHAIHR